MSDRVVCTCIGITEDEIIASVKEGATTSDAIAEELQAGSVCGACVSEIEQIIEENK